MSAARRPLIDLAGRLRRRARGGSDAAPRVDRRRRRPGAERLRVAVVGTGRVAPHHLGVLAAQDDVDIVGLANRGRSDASELASRYGVARTASDYRALLDEARPDLVYVLVGVTEIPAVAAEVLGRGLPCLIEKPAGLYSDDTARLAELAAAGSVTHLVGVNRRFHSVVEHALEAVLERGRLLGIHLEVHEAIASLTASGRHAPEVLERWVVANSIHGIDLLRRCAGEIERLEVVENRDGRDSIAAAGVSERGVVCSFAAHWQSPTGVRLVLHGDGVRAELGPLEHGELVAADGSRSRLPIDEVDVEFKPGFYGQTAALLDAVASGKSPEPPASDLADQVRTMRLAEAIGGLPSGRPA